MKTSKILSSLIAVFAGIVLFAPGQSLAAAFGVSPPWIENETLKPGSNFVYVINLSAKDLMEDMKVVSEFTGDSEIAQWLTVVNKDNLVMPKGQNIVPMSVAVNIPEGARVGKYNGSLKLSLTTTNGQRENVAVLLGSNIAIKLGVVSHDITDYWVQAISTETITEGQPIPLKIDIKNLGNTPILSVMTKVKVSDIKTGAMLASGSVDALNLPVYPQTMAKTQLSFVTPDLMAGTYWLDVEAHKDGISVYQNRLYLTVMPSNLRSAISTGVDVAEEGWVKPAAPAEGMDKASKAVVPTSVTVRAPLTNQLIMVVIGILLVLTGFAAKIYTTTKKKKRS